MIDSHCHIDLEAFDSDRDIVLQRAFQEGITRLLVLGLHNKQFDLLLALKRQYEQVDIALGLHPFFLHPLNQLQTQCMQDEFAKLASQHAHHYIAFGEMGLDASIDLDMRYQQEILSFQLSLAVTYHKPVILHHRQSHNLLIRLLKQARYQGGGILHAFSGSYQEALAYIDMGFLLGIGGTITYPRAKKTREAIRQIPLDKLLLETDSPDMPIAGFQGLRNEPSRLTLVRNALSELKGVTPQEVEAKTSLNYSTLFGLSE